MYIISTPNEVSTCFLWMAFMVRKHHRVCLINLSKLTNFAEYWAYCFTCSRDSISPFSISFIKIRIFAAIHWGSVIFSGIGFHELVHKTRQPSLEFNTRSSDCSVECDIYIQNHPSVLI